MFGLGLIEMLVMLAIPVVVVAAVIRLAVRGGRRPELHASPDIAALAERTARLEENLANMQDQMARLAESQEFTVKLLTDRK